MHVFATFLLLVQVGLFVVAVYFAAVPARNELPVGVVLTSCGTCVNGTAGVDGLHCWDLNMNHICDTSEDINLDGNCTTADCNSLDVCDGVVCTPADCEIRVCILGQCVLTGYLDHCCSEDEQCQDGNPCTSDLCVDNTCVNGIAGCSVDHECPSGQICSDCNCTSVIPVGYCWRNSDCNDNVTCTLDLCEHDRTCSSLAVPGCCSQDSDCINQNDTCSLGRTCNQANGLCQQSTIDNDGDGLACYVDCDDSDQDVGSARIWYRDQDSDGYGSLVDPHVGCEAPMSSGYALLGGDCQETNFCVRPEQVRFCNGYDNDCDGIIDDQQGAIDCLDGIYEISSVSELDILGSALSVESYGDNIIQGAWIEHDVGTLMNPTYNCSILAFYSNSTLGTTNGFFSLTAGQETLCEQPSFATRPQMSSVHDNNTHFIFLTKPNQVTNSSEVSSDFIMYCAPGNPLTTDGYLRKVFDSGLNHKDPNVLFVEDGSLYVFYVHREYAETTGTIKYLLLTNVSCTNQTALDLFAAQTFNVSVPGVAFRDISVTFENGVFHIAALESNFTLYYISGSTDNIWNATNLDIRVAEGMVIRSLANGRLVIFYGTLTGAGATQRVIFGVLAANGTSPPSSWEDNLVGLGPKSSNNVQYNGLLGVGSEQTFSTVKSFMDFALLEGSVPAVTANLFRGSSRAQAYFVHCDPTLERGSWTRKLDIIDVTADRYTDIVLLSHGGNATLVVSALQTTSNIFVQSNSMPNATLWS